MESCEIKVGTFFSGVGSPEQALKNLVEGGAEVKNKPLEIEIEFACEIDKYAEQTYLKNFKPKKFYSDITTLEMKDLSYVDLLVFGFPCQAFSVAGKRQGFDDTRGTLFYDALRYLQEHRPRYFVAENVRGLVSHDNGKTFGTIIDCLAKTTNYQMSLMPFENLGYHIHHKVLNTKNFGIPQNRERIFIIGIRDDEDNNFNFPKEIPLECKLRDILQNNVSEKYYLSDKAVKGIENSTYERKKHIIQHTDVCATLLGRDYKDPKCIETKGASLRTYPRTTNPEKDKEQGRNKRLETRKDDLANSITTHEHDSLIKNKRVRRLTPIECERLQGFPDNFTEGVSDTQRYKQMGNTISVPVIETILENLLQ